MSVAINGHKTSDTAYNRLSCALGLSLESDMSETKNDERGASGAVKATAWVCDECGTAVEQSMRPTVCHCCTKWNERRGLPVPDADFGPLYDAETVVALLQEAYKRGVADGERGSMRGVHDMVTEVTK